MFGCAMNFDLNSELRRELGYRLIDVVDEFFGSLPNRAVQLAPERHLYAPRLTRLPEKGHDLHEVFTEVCHELIDRGVHIPSAHYLGMMNPTPTYMAFLAEP